LSPAPPFGREDFHRATGVSRETLDRLDAYVALLTKWQRRINLVARASLGDVWRRHLLDSAQLAEYLPAAPARVVDLGSGAGFPGLVLAIVTGHGVELIESDGRKCAFLTAVATETGARVTIHQTRIEAMPRRPADVITARACAPLSRLLGYAERFKGPDTVCLFHKGARVDEELTEAAKTWMMDFRRHPSQTDPQGTLLSFRDFTRVTRR
jgi:16S rRNA (guanine527-N7)-methyltransferase